MTTSIHHQNYTTLTDATQSGRPPPPWLSIEWVALRQQFLHPLNNRGFVVWL